MQQQFMQQFMQSKLVQIFNNITTGDDMVHAMQGIHRRTSDAF